MCFAAPWRPVDHPAGTFPAKHRMIVVNQPASGNMLQPQPAVSAFSGPLPCAEQDCPMLVKNGGSMCQEGTGAAGNKQILLHQCHIHPAHRGKGILVRYSIIRGITEVFVKNKDIFPAGCRLTSAKYHHNLLSPVEEGNLSSLEQTPEAPCPPCTLSKGP